MSNQRNWIHDEHEHLKSRLGTSLISFESDLACEKKNELFKLYSFTFDQ